MGSPEQKQPLPTNAPAVSAPVLNNANLQQPTPENQNYGTRPDGTSKGTGWLGELKRPDGKVSTEISAGVNFNGKQHLIPLIVPGLEKEELNYLLTTDPEHKDFFNKMPKTILQKAVSHAQARMKQDLSPFAN
jgi:hypothetical protein